MTFELTILALAGLLHIGQFAFASYRASADVGTEYSLGPRDHMPTQQMRPATARLMRAYDNSAVMLPLFGLAVMLIAVTDQSTMVTKSAAAIYLAARVLYTPAYALGWQPWRSVIWIVALTCCTLLYFAALF